jgi:hypothetical protein
MFFLVFWLQKRVGPMWPTLWELGLRALIGFEPVFSICAFVGQWFLFYRKKFLWDSFSNFSNFVYYLTIEQTIVLIVNFRFYTRRKKPLQAECD